MSKPFPSDMTEAGVRAKLLPYSSNYATPPHRARLRARPAHTAPPRP